MKNYIYKFTDFILKMGAGFVLMLAPIHDVLITLGLLLFADVIMGIWAAKKLKERVSSKRLRDSASKLFIYQTVIIFGFLVETHLIGGIVPVVKPIAGLLGMIELKSLLENCSLILGRDLFKDMIERLGSKSDKKFPDEKNDNSSRTES